MKVIGKNIPRVDALGKVTGRAVYADDIKIPGMIYGKVVRTRYPHARILNVDVSKAKALPGVYAVLTAKDIPGSNRVGVAITKDQPVIADDKVRYMGDAVAVIAARDMKTAEKAARLVEVQYEPLPVVVDQEEALSPNAPKIHEKGNLICHHKVRKGNIEHGFKEADIIVERLFKTQMIEHSYIEPESVVAEPLEDGGVRVTGCMQNIYTTRRVLSAVLNLPLHKIECVQTHIGGSFGGKDDSMNIIASRAALLALKTNRPVKITYTREESMIDSYKRHPYKLYYKIGLKKDGSICAMEIKIFANGGAYASMSEFVTWRSVVQATGPYRVPNVSTDIYAAYTNLNYTGAMRGFGSPQIILANETLMDECAQLLGIDPYTFRKKNLFVTGDTTATGQVLPGYVSINDVVDAVVRASDYLNKWRMYKERQGEPAVKKRGIGLACSYRGVSLGAEGADFGSCVVNLQEDGTATLSIGITDMGQGARTAQAQFVSELLGLTLDRIKVLEINTSRSPDSGPTVASRGTLIAGNAIKDACSKIRKTLERVATDFVGTSQEFVFEDNMIINPGTNQSVPIERVIRECVKRKLPLSEAGFYAAPHTNWHEEEGQGLAYFTYVYGANVAEVEVDTETGKVEVLKVWSAHEVGRAINPEGVKGQIYGGVAMGLGLGLIEEFEFKDAVPQTINFDEYLIPTSMDVPEVVPIIVENPDPVGPFGAKSVGEPANELAAPAILNAIFNATGKRITETPANLEVVLLGKKLKK